MAAASYSSDVLQMYYGRIDEAIQSLPLELREIIYKEYVAMKQRERAALGWRKVHEALLEKPFDELLEQIAPAIVCIECMSHRFGGCCNLCAEVRRTVDIVKNIEIFSDD